MSDCLMFVTTSFEATHSCVEGVEHPHTWRVRAWFGVARRTDMRCYRAALAALLDGWRGKKLPEHLEWCEDLADAILMLTNCVRVWVWRDEDEEGIGAEVSR